MEIFLSTESKKVKMASERLLQFTTGSICIPPMGFDSSPIMNSFIANYVHYVNYSITAKPAFQSYWSCMFWYSKY